MVSRKVIVLRINNYYNYDFIAEHNKIANKNGNVWFLKIGRKIPKKKLEELIQNKGILVLKTGKKQGGIYYETSVQNYHYGKPLDSMSYPKYYDELLDSLSYTKNVSADGTWVSINPIKEMEEERIQKLFLKKTGEPICELINKCSTACMYAELISEED